MAIWLHPLVEGDAASPEPEQTAIDSSLGSPHYAPVTIVAAIGLQAVRRGPA